MEEIIILTVVTGFVFLFFILVLIFGLTKKSEKIKLIAFFLLFVFLGLTGWTTIKFVNKAYNKVTNTLRPRNGDEIYDALFDKRQTNCIKILNYQDQVVPKIDYAIWLHFESCPKEVHRILSRHEFTVNKIPIEKLEEKMTNHETFKWFNPRVLGDTIIVYEYSINDHRNIQTIWTNLDSTKVFVRDILD